MEAAGGTRPPTIRTAAEALVRRLAVRAKRLPYLPPRRTVPASSIDLDAEEVLGGSGQSRGRYGPTEMTISRVARRSDEARDLTLQVGNQSSAGNRASSSGSAASSSRLDQNPSRSNTP